MTIWFITGASRGFGLEIARQALAQGDRVVATARDPRAVDAALPGNSGRLLTLPLDVTDTGRAAEAVATAVDRFGGIDVLVNNAGRGLLGAVEETSDAEARAIFDINVFGLLAVTRAVLPVMRRRGSGRIINLSSVGGFVSWAGSGLYCATKFAVEALTESLRIEAAPFGVQVTAVEPGPFRTDFLDPSSLHRTAAVIDAYAASSGALRTWADDTNHGQAGDPVKGAAAVLLLAATAEPPTRLPLGSATVTDIEDKLARVAREVDAWREVARSTDYPAGDSAGERSGPTGELPCAV
ncbi:oxidoreductase [Streptomyces sp. NPDC001922]|uniref:oxidoreductase n=1 Tax=Streptomyces sp. NPDC001922 TaxID=3364624 RepID=UPI0036B2BD82